MTQLGNHVLDFLVAEPSRVSYWFNSEVTRQMAAVTDRSEYQECAAQCRRMACQTTNPEQRRQLEEMAGAWEMLARERDSTRPLAGSTRAVDSPSASGE